MTTRLVSVAEAADVLGLPVTGVEALVDAGYLRPRGEDLLSMSDIKAFQVRNQPGPDGSGDGAEAIDRSTADLLAEIHGADVGAEEILEALEAAVPEMASRAADIVGGVFPEAASWSIVERERFERHARDRFSAILAVTRASETDDDLLADLERAGGAAAFAGAPLPQVLLTLRISRDLLVQTAVSASEELGKEWGLALAVVLTRVLPVLDRLTDRIATGYWAAVGLREKEAFARYEHVVEHSASGVYEVDLSGAVRYANPTMASICGVEVDAMLDTDLAMALPPADHFEDVDVYRTPTQHEWRHLRVLRADGVVRELQLQITARTHEGETVGFDGVVRDVTAELELERQKNDFLGVVTRELRQPIATILGLGATLGAHADEIPRDRIARMGESIHNQCERVVRLADDVADVARIRADQLTVTLRPVVVANACDAAQRMLPAHSADVTVDVDPDLRAMADGRRLEQVIAHLVENGLLHGTPPVRIRARRSEGTVEIEVTDDGDGVPDAELDDLFAMLRPTGDSEVRRRDRVSGLGLPLARTLVEAMGGRLSYAPLDRGARFVLRLPAATA